MTPHCLSLARAHSHGFIGPIKPCHTLGPEIAQQFDEYLADVGPFKGLSAKNTTPLVWWKAGLSAGFPPLLTQCAIRFAACTAGKGCEKCTCAHSFQKKKIVGLLINADQSEISVNGCVL